MADQTISVSTSDELHAALVAARGGETILLEPNREGYSLSFWKSEDLPALDATTTITSLDPENPAELKELSLREADNLAFRDVVFTCDRGGMALRIDQGENISIRDVDFQGPAAGPWLKDDEDMMGGRALLAHDSVGLEFVGNTVSNFAAGVIVMRSDRVRLEDNLIKEIQVDGIRLGGVQDVVVADNMLRDWIGVANENSHADFIQLWAQGMDRPTTDLTISGNVMIASESWGNQSIFLSNSTNKFINTNLSIENNLILNGHAHGVYVEAAHHVDIVDNVMIHNPDAAVRKFNSDAEVSYAPLIRLRGRTEDATITGNATSKIALLDGSKAHQDENVFLDSQDPDYRAQVEAVLENLEGWEDDPRFALFLERLEPILNAQAGESGESGGTAGGSMKLIGDASDDHLVGGKDDDHFLLRHGDDVAVGGGGADRFIIDDRYVTNGDSHRIDDTDFAAGDTVEFRFFPLPLRTVGSLDDLTALVEAGADASQNAEGEAQLNLVNSEEAAVSVTLGGVGYDGESFHLL